MKSKSFVRYTTKKDKGITYTPMFNKNFVDTGASVRESKANGIASNELAMLKAEKLKTVWELIRYEDYYISKGSIRSRLKSIFDLTSEIKSEIKLLETGLAEDESWLKIIESTIRAPSEPSESAVSSKEKHLNLAWQEHYICCKYKESLCCCQISINQQKDKIKIRIHTNSCSKSIFWQMPLEESIIHIVKENPKAISEYLNIHGLDASTIVPTDETILITQEKSGEFADIDSRSDIKSEETRSACGDLDMFSEDLLVLSGIMMIDMAITMVKLYYHPSMLCYKLEISMEKIKKIFYDFEYKKQFTLLKSLQFKNLFEVKQTLLRSLEFEYTVRTLFELSH